MVNNAKKRADDFVIGTGKTYSVKDFAKIAFEHVGLDYKKYIKIDKKLFRPAEVDLLKADYSKAKKELKWKPEISFKEMVKNMVDTDIRLVKKIIMNNYLFFRTDRIGDFLLSAILIKSIKKNDSNHI